MNRRTRSYDAKDREEQVERVDDGCSRPHDVCLVPTMPLRVTTIRTISNLASTWSSPSRTPNRILARRCRSLSLSFAWIYCVRGMEQMPVLLCDHVGGNKVES